MQSNGLLLSLAPLWKKWILPLHKAKWAPTSNTDDFGLEITSLLLSKKIDQRSHSLVKSILAGKSIWEGITFLNTADNIKNLDLGFGIEEAEAFYYVRDTFIRLADGSLRMPVYSAKMEDVVARVHSSSLYLDRSAATRTSYQLFNHWGGYTAKYRENSLIDKERLFKGKCNNFSYSYIEGGNLFSLTNLSNERCILVGEDHRYHTFLILELEGRNWDALAQKAGLGTSLQEIANKNSSLSPYLLQLYAREMFSLGLIVVEDKTGLLSESDQLNLLLEKFYAEGNLGPIFKPGWFDRLAVEKGLIPPFQPELYGSDVLCPLVLPYLAKLTIVDALMAQDLGVSREQLHFITQANYHLDMFLAPGPGHVIFLTDYRFCADLLEKLRESQLSAKDLEHVEAYYRAACKLDQGLRPLLVRVKLQLEFAGFCVVPMPGHWIYEPRDMYNQFPLPSGGFSINFMNALTGHSSKTGKYYYLTHGLQVGDRLGKEIMEIVTVYLQLYIPELDVFFLGHSPEGDFSEALDFWNRIDTQSGIHCVTFPVGYSE